MVGMSENRFWFVIDKGKLEYVQDNVTGEKITVSELEDLLNEQQTEITELKELNDDKGKRIISLIRINKTLKEENKTFLQVAKNKEVPNSINNIAHELVEKYPNENITDLMRIFAREYPFYKSESSLLFGVLKVIKNV